MTQISKAVRRFLKFPAFFYLHSPAHTLPVPRSPFVESFVSVPRLLGDADRRSLTILRKQIKITMLSFLIMGEEGWGAKDSASREEKFIESTGHWRYGIYRKPLDRSSYSKRSASPLSPPKNQRFEVAERSARRIHSWRL